MCNEPRVFLFTVVLLSSNIFLYAAMQPTKYLEQPQAYNDFRFTRSYGAFKCNATGLSNDIFNNHIAPFLSFLLAKDVSTKCKHRFLSEKWDGKGTQKSLFQEIEIMPILFVHRPPNIDWKAFEYHDGTYVLVPDIADYKMWDGKTGLRYETKFGNDEKSIKLSVQSIYKSIPRLSISGQEYDRNMLYMNNQQETRSVMFSEEMALPLLSCDGSLLCVWPEHNGDRLRFFDTQTLQLKQKYRVCGPIKAVCAAHQSLIFAASSDNSVTLIDLSRVYSVVSYAKKFFPVRSLQFSPDDTRLCVQGDTKLCIYYMNPNQGLSIIDFRNKGTIQKVAISPDSNMIAIAFASGRLQLIKNLPNSTIYDAARWRYFNVESGANDTIKPLILWDNDDDLLITLNPSYHFNYLPISLVIRKSTNGRFLAEHIFWPYYPIAMGLPKDGQSIIVVYPNRAVSRLELYNCADLDDIHFITKEANWYQLSCLWQAYKKSKIKHLNEHAYHTNAQTVLKIIRSLIAEYRKSALS